MPKSKTAPVLTDAARKLIYQKIREGHPFAVSDCYTREFAELAEKCAPNPEDRYGKPVIEYCNLVLNFALKRKEFRGKLWKRINRATGKVQRLAHSPSHMLYPSNDRERFHLNDYEVFMPHHITPSDAAWKEYVEPPVRIVANTGLVEVTDVEVPVTISAFVEPALPETPAPEWHDNGKPDVTTVDSGVLHAVAMNVASLMDVVSETARAAALSAAKLAEMVERSK